jgi:hypothetical protein
MLAHIGESTSPPLLHPARGKLETGLDGGEAEKAAQEFLPLDLDKSPKFDPTDPEPIPSDQFAQTHGWYPLRLTGPAPGVPAEVKRFPFPSPSPSVASFLARSGI